MNNVALLFTRKKVFMKKNITASGFLIILFFINSCGSREYTEDGIKEIVEEINVNLEQAVGEEFNWGSPEAYSLFRAYFYGDELIFINESYTYKIPAEASNRYYFKDGNMLHLKSKKIGYAQNNESGRGKKVKTTLEFYSDPDENILLYHKLANNQRTALSNEEAEEIFRHVDELKEIINKRGKVK